MTKQEMMVRIHSLESSRKEFEERLLNLQDDYQRALKELNDLKRAKARSRKAKRGTRQGLSYDVNPVYP